MPNSAISVNSMVVASGNQVSSELGNDVVIMDIKGGVYHGLNATGARIWTLVQQARSVGEIRDAICKEFDVDPTRCQRDVLALLEQLASKGLVQVLPSAPRAIPA